MKSIKKVLTATEVAELLGVNRETVYRLARNNLIPHFHVGSTVRFSKDKIEEWIVGEKH